MRNAVIIWSSFNFLRKCQTFFIIVRITVIFLLSIFSSTMKNNQIQSAFFDFNSECTLRTMNKGFIYYRLHYINTAIRQYLVTLGIDISVTMITSKPRLIQICIKDCGKNLLTEFHYKITGLPPNFASPIKQI